MKRFIGCVLFSIIATQAVLAQISNKVHLVVPTNNLVAAHFSYQGGDLFRIAPNTPAFEDYGVSFMLAQANAMSVKWRLEIPKPLTLNDVFFYVKATALGIEGIVETRDARFRWVFFRNAITSFWDLKYAPRSFRYHDDESARLAKIKSKITAQEAEAIARNALHQIGITEELLRLKKPPEVNQYKFEESDGTVYPLPTFNVTWRYEGPTNYATENLELSPVNMEVSGIISNVVEYVNSDVFNSDSHLPHPPMPTNYFQMLGLPPNFLETVPERKRLVWGLPPLTNTPSQSTNSEN